MALNIEKSVGKYPAANQPKDLKNVVTLLNLVLPKMGSTLQVALTDGGTIVKGICDFQWHHFKLVTGRVAPNSATLDKLNEVSYGERGLNALVEFPRMVATWRAMIHRVASFEADRTDRVPGIDATGKHTKEGKERLKVYFQKVYPGAQSWKDEWFYDPTPQSVAWCGVFASWVLTQAQIPVEWALDKHGIWGMRWSAPPTKWENGIPMAQDRYYTKGDVLVVHERGDGKHPTHHVIVANEVPDKNNHIATIEGNIPDSHSNRQCSVTRSTRPAQAYQHYCPFLPKVL
jgi:hypothetical protein